MPRLSDIAARFGGAIYGDAAVDINGVASLSSAGRGQLAFYESIAHRTALQSTAAAAVLLSADACEETACPQWRVEGSPRLVFARLAQWLSLQTPPAGISDKAHIAEDAHIGNHVTIAPFAVIESGAHIGDGCRIGAGAVVGGGAVIGDETVLMARATVYSGVRVGRRCIIHSGAVVGADGFGFVRDESGAQIKIPQCGSVQLADDVEVGANSAIDRGALDDTIIGRGVKIDNLVQIGHNVRVGDNTVICGCVGIAGSTVLGQNCMVGGGAGIAGHLTIGDNAMIAARASVTRSLPAGAAVSSVFPAMPVAQWRRFVGTLRRIVSQRGGGQHG